MSNKQNDHYYETIDEDKEEMNAKDYYKMGLNCAEAVVKSSGVKSLETVNAIKNLGGGIANSGDTCGAFLGGVLAIGIKNGRNYEKVQEFIRQFREKNGSIRCVRGHKYKTTLTCADRCELAGKLCKIIQN